MARSDAKIVYVFACLGLMLGLAMAWIQELGTIGDKLFAGAIAGGILGRVEYFLASTRKKWPASFVIGHSFSLSQL